jgi:hypothetical protein
MRAYVIIVIITATVFLNAGTNIVTGPYERLMIAGETAVNGIFDPSLEYAGDGTGYLAYSSVEGQRHVHTCIAKSLDHGKTWTKLLTVNRSYDENVPAAGGAGCWRHEVSTLVHDPGDAGKGWKLYWHKYFTKPPFGGNDRNFLYGWIAYKYAPKPEGPWSDEVALFRAGTFPPAPYSAAIDLDSLHDDLKEVIVYSELGSLAIDSVLYLSMNAHVMKGPQNIGRVILIASHDHGKTWKYVRTLLTPEDVKPYDGLYFTGSSIAIEDGKAYLLACPEKPGGMEHHKGTIVFGFADLARGLLFRDENGKPLAVKHIKAMTSGGQSDYDEKNTYGGVIMPELDTEGFLKKTALDVFRIFNTKTTLGR